MFLHFDCIKGYKISHYTMSFEKVNTKEYLFCEWKNEKKERKRGGREIEREKKQYFFCFFILRKIKWLFIKVTWTRFHGCWSDSFFIATPPNHINKWLITWHNAKFNRLFILIFWPNDACINCWILLGNETHCSNHLGFHFDMRVFEYLISSLFVKSFALDS